MLPQPIHQAKKLDSGSDCKGNLDVLPTAHNLLLIGELRNIRMGDFGKFVGCIAVDSVTYYTTGKDRKCAVLFRIGTLL